MLEIPKKPTGVQRDGATFRYQSNLPKQPVPDLHETLQKYLDSVRPLLNENQYKQTLKTVDEFAATNGMGTELQRRLIEHSKDPKVINWYADFYVNTALCDRNPLFAATSYYFVYKDDELFKTPARRAAAITRAALEFKRQIIERELEPDSVLGTPLCMDLYDHLFNSCRVASKQIDKMVKYDPFINTHIVVIRKNKFYVVDCVYEDYELSTNELEQQFQRIIDHAGSEKGVPIGCFTADNRDKSAEFRNLLLEASPLNAKWLEKIESASFVVCLDDTSPESHDELSRASWHGDGRSRFFDKTAQFVVFENGKAAFIAEHMYADGSTTHRLSEFICGGLAKKTINHGPEKIRKGIPQPSEILFNISRDIESAISHAEKRFDRFVKQSDMSVLLYQGYGKNLIKKYKCSPDGLVQMIIQLAYFRMFGASKPTYSTTQTRQYQRGRSENCRTVCEESVAFVKAMGDPSLTPKQRMLALRSALNSHKRIMGDARKGKGIDRHLLSLTCMLRPEDEIPMMFTDYAFKHSCDWIISASQVTSKYFECYGWSATHEKAINSPYMINNDSLQFCISSYKDIVVDGKEYTDVTFRFKNHLQYACDDLYNLILSDNSDISKL